MATGSVLQDRPVLTYRLFRKVSSQIFTVPREITPVPRLSTEGELFKGVAFERGVKARCRDTAADFDPKLRG